MTDKDLAKRVREVWRVIEAEARDERGCVRTMREANVARPGWWRAYYIQRRETRVLILERVAAHLVAAVRELDE